MISSHMTCVKLTETNWHTYILHPGSSLRSQGFPAPPRGHLARAHSPSYLLSTLAPLPRVPAVGAPLCSMGNLHIAVLALNDRKNQYRSFIPASGDSPNPSTFVTGANDHLYCHIGFCPESTQAPEPQERHKSVRYHAFHLDLC